jgi:flagellum-specific ATP synthase
MIRFDPEPYLQTLQTTETVLLKGRITKIIGLVIESLGPSINLGELCFIYPRNGSRPIRAEAVGFREDRVLLMPLGEMQGIGPGCEVVSSPSSMKCRVGPRLLGRILDGLGNPMDGKGIVLTDNE